jgi:hypothetical protein
MTGVDGAADGAAAANGPPHGDNRSGQQADSEGALAVTQVTDAAVGQGALTAAAGATVSSYTPEGGDGYGGQGGRDHVLGGGSPEPPPPQEQQQQ